MRFALLVLCVLSSAAQALAGARQIGVAELLLLTRQGAVVVDVRPADDFAAGHLRGSINLGLSPKLAEFGPRAVRRDARVVAVAARLQEDDAVSALRRAGYARVVGVLAGGIGALAHHPSLLERSRRLTADELARELAGSRAPTVLDVRTTAEHTAGRIPGAIHIPLDELAHRARELPAGRRIVAHCGGGYRSSLAASVLRRLGRSDVDDLAGGYEAWRARPGTSR